MMIHPTSIISKSAVIESDVSVGPFTIIYEILILNLVPQ